MVSRMKLTAYNRGWQAYLDGYSLADNPYRRGGPFADEWERGWLDARTSNTRVPKRRRR